MPELIQIQNFNNCITKFCETYSKTEKPIEVSFRDIVDRLKNPDRATHLIHPYPAKLLTHIPYFFLNNQIFSKRGDVVLDPFCGSGTVPLEALLAERNAVGADSNPLARLITEVKTSCFNISKLKNLTAKLSNSIPSKPEIEMPNVVNLDYWFLPNIKPQLLNILYAIKGIGEKVYRNFFSVCFSNIVRKVSLADPRVSVPVRLRFDQYPENHPLRKKTKQRLNDFNNIDVVELYFKLVHANIKRFERFNSLRKNGVSAEIISSDSRFLAGNKKNNGMLKDESIDLVISSPPYAGAQKYIRACSLSLGWLEIANEHEIRYLKSMSIGREEYLKNEYKSLLQTGVAEADLLLRDIYRSNPLRAHIAANYLIEMRQALKQTIKTLKKEGIMILIVANNHVCGKQFKTQEYLTNICQEFGLNILFRLIDDIRSYGLMTKRNKTASIITREWVLVFRKG